MGYLVISRNFIENIDNQRLDRIDQILHFLENQFIKHFTGDDRIPHQIILILSALAMKC